MENFKVIMDTVKTMTVNGSKEEKARLLEVLFKFHFKL